MKLFPRLAAVFVLILCQVCAFAQEPASDERPITSPTPTMTDEEAAKAVAGCAACGGGALMAVIVAFVLNVALLIWVARDAKSRGMDSSVLWMLLVFFTSFLGLIIYLFSRPQGQLMQCTSCGNKRLAASAKCPHCGNA